MAAKSRRRRRSVVVATMVVRTRSAGRLAAMNRSGRWGVMAMVTMMVTPWSVGVDRGRRRGRMDVRSRCQRMAGTFGARGRCRGVNAGVRSGRRDQQQHCHHHGHDDDGEKLDERRHFGCVTAVGERAYI
jgi:hypothetical protein